MLSIQHNKDYQCFKEGYLEYHHGVIEYYIKNQIIIQLNANIIILVQQINIQVIITG